MNADAGEFFLYNRETGQFVRRGDWRALSLESAAESLSLIWPYQPSINSEQARQKLQDIKEIGVPSSEILKIKGMIKKKDSLDWDSIYSEVKLYFPIVFYFGHDKRRQVFFKNEIKEVTPISYERERDIFDALCSNQEVWKNLKQFYMTHHLLDKHRSKISLTKFVETAIHEYLLTDEELNLAEEPLGVSWSNDDYAFKKIQLDLVSEGQTPSWDEFTSRLDYPELFLAWVWSIIEPTNTVRQVCWIRGGGQDGKSAVQKALESVVGRGQSYSMSANDIDNQFFLGSVHGKILVSYPDCNYLNLLRNEKIKQITGSDIASIERKNQQSRSGALRAKLFVHSNRAPRINPESRFQTTRLMLLELQQTEIRDAGFADKLKSEIWQFLYKCQQAYKLHIAPGGDNILIHAEAFQKMLDASSGDSYRLCKFFESEYIEYNKDFVCEHKDLLKALEQFRDENYLDRTELKYVKDEHKDILQDRKIDMCQHFEHEGKMIYGYKGFRVIKGC